MNRLTLLPLALLPLLPACGTTTPQLDARFGEAVLAARAQQTLDPDAPNRPPPPERMEGRAAANAISSYQKSFKAPPPTFNVINIGGGITGGEGQ